MRNKDGFLFVFSIIKRKSFIDLREFFEEMREVHEESKIPPIILVGNKVDLDRKSTVNKHESYSGSSNYNVDAELNDKPKLSYVSVGSMSDMSGRGREISFEEAVQFASKLNCIAYIETSAKTGYNVRNMFGKLVRSIVNKQIRKQRSRANANDGGICSKCVLL